MTTESALLSLEDAYREAAWDRSADSVDDSSGRLEGLGTDDAGYDDHARARVEEASPFGLVARLQGTPNTAAPSSLGDALDLLRSADRLASWASAQRTRLVAHVHSFSNSEHHTWSGPASSLAFTETVVEKAALLRLSEGSAARLVSESLTLTSELTETLKALETGRICPARASVIVEQSRTLPDDAVKAFESEILKSAADLNRPKLTARCRRLRERLHPETITARRAKAAADRCVVFQPDQDGMAWFSAFLPAEQALALHTTVDATARTLRAGDDPRTLPQLRADVFADMLLTSGLAPEGTTGVVSGPSGVAAGLGITSGPGVAPGADEGCRCGGTGTGGGRNREHARSATAKIVVTVPVFSLMRLTDEPAELEGYGPIPADAARKLAADATSWMRLLTHPYTGAVLGLDRTRYRPSEDLRTWVQLRNKTCSFFGCSRAASRCDLDHLLAWADDGSTDSRNLYPACKRHHMIKHQTDWTPTPDPDGALSWLSPGGRIYTTRPDPPPSSPSSSEESPSTRVLQDLDTALGAELRSPVEAPPAF